MISGGIKMSIPADLYYSKEHIWVKKEGNQVKIGVTEFGQDELGDIVFVELPEVGEEVEIDEPFGSVESVKTVSELYAPVSGKIVALNEQLEENPEFINESPYEKAWIIEIDLADDSELSELLTPDEYVALIEYD